MTLTLKAQFEGGTARVEGNLIVFKVGDRTVSLNRGCSESVDAMRRTLGSKHVAPADVEAILKEVGSDPRKFFDPYDTREDEIRQRFVRRPRRRRDEASSASA